MRQTEQLNAPCLWQKMRRASEILAISLAGLLVASGALAQSQPAAPTTAQARSLPGTSSTMQPASAAAAQTGSQASKPASKSAGRPFRNLPARFAGRAGVYYKAVWGIDSLTIKWAESGELIRFSWRVLDPVRAGVLNDKKAEPSLIDPQAGVSLVVPTMEKVGQLRQSGLPQAGRSYWMEFSNKGRLVKRGDRVEVVIGPFRAENLVVD